MIKTFLAAACAAALLCGCATGSAETARMTAGKAIADGWLGFDGAAQLADGAVKAGYLHGPPAATASQDLKLASASLTAATSAYQAGKGDTATQIAAAAAAVAEVLTIVGQAEKGAQ